MWSLIPRLWRAVPSTVRLLGAGVIAGVILSAVACPSNDHAKEIALQNALAALDSTRKIAAGKDTVAARLLAQRAVALTGALREVTKLRKANAKLESQLVIATRPIDTTSTHQVPPSAIRRDSLTLAGPPVTGVVSVAIDSTAIRWAARLRVTPVPLDVVVGCGKSGPEVFVHGPAWIDTQIGPGQVDPAVCHGTASRFGSGFRWGIAATAGGYVVFRIAKSLLAR